MPRDSGASSLLDLAKTGGEAWQEVFDTCYELGGKPVKILSVGPAATEPEAGQRVRAIEASIVDPEIGEAYVVFHIGVQGDEVFTGYEQLELRDYYQVTLPDGRVYGDELYWPDQEEKDEETPMAKAWQAVSPLKMTAWWATYARLLDGRSLVG